MVIVVILSMISIIAFAQKETPQELLQRASDKINAYKTMSANFVYTLENTGANLTDSQTGKLTLKGDKYILELGKQIIINDGKTIYTILKDAEEIQVNNAADMDDLLSPNKILTEYYQKFKAKSVTNKTIKGIPSQVIELDAGKDKDFSSATLIIAKSDLSPKELQLIDKKGTKYIYQINNFKANNPIDDAEFTFNKNDYSGFEVIDMR
ncbi:MAG: outer membrane lipoprotein carrier protein LolA [Bacteroidales bacterium]|nr:outer membrane lipoprotein carrier protein LolA [Bacteroidales bacterium]